MITLFLAAVIGWYLVVVSLLVLFRESDVKLVVADVTAQRGLFFVLALITFILGLIMVLSHNIWIMSWPVIITLLSWLVLISGLLRLFSPDTAKRMSHSFISSPWGMKIWAIILLIIGVFLLLQVYHPII